MAAIGLICPDSQEQEKIKVMSCYKDLIFHCEKNKVIQPNEWLKNIFDNFFSFKFKTFV
jgi:hypothetical protein